MYSLDRRYGGQRKVVRLHLLGDASADAEWAGKLLKDEQAKAEFYKNPNSGSRISEAEYNLWKAASEASPQSFVPVAWRPGSPLPTQEQIGKMVSADYPQGMRPTVEAEFREYMLLVNGANSYADFWERAQRNKWFVPVSWSPGQPAPLPSQVKTMVSPSYPQGFRPTTQSEFEAYAASVAAANAFIQTALDNKWFVPAGWHIGDIGVLPSQVKAMISLDYPDGSRPASKEESESFVRAQASLSADIEAAAAKGWLVPVLWRRGWPPPTRAAITSMATEDYPSGWRPATQEEFEVFSATVEAMVKAREAGMSSLAISDLLKAFAMPKGFGLLGMAAGACFLGLIGHRLYARKKAARP